MHPLDKQQVVQRLMAEFTYPEHGAHIVADKLLALQPVLAPAFAQWWQSGVVAPLEVEGYTVAKLQREHGMHPVAAILTLDWLLRDPERAKSSLQRGHDRVGAS
jgi:hypothetical protein